MIFLLFHLLLLLILIYRTSFLIFLNFLRKLRPRRGRWRWYRTTILRYIGPHHLIIILPYKLLYIIYLNILIKWLLLYYTAIIPANFLYIILLLLINLFLPLLFDSVTIQTRFRLHTLVMPSNKRNNPILIKLIHPHNVKITVFFQLLFQI